MRKLHIDIETYSGVSIRDCGLYKYAMDPSFEILLVAYAYDDEPTRIIDLAKGEELTDDFIIDLMSPAVIKYAHNAAFERVCFTMWFRRHDRLCKGEWLDPSQWRCTMIRAARCGLPLSLGQVGEVLDFDQQKMSEGKGLIQLFCCPRRTRVSDGLFEALPDRVQPEEYPEDWETFKAYCIRDVDVERQIEKELSWYEVSDAENTLYAIDQRINDYGALIDLDLAREAVRMDTMLKARLNAEAVTITGLNNPNSPAQLKQWLSDQLGRDVTDITKGAIPDLMKEADGKPLVQRVLRIRTEMGKTSNAKYGAMLDVAGADGRVRGMTQFYGTRTGRWAGRFVQMQNLPQNHIGALDEARRMLRDGDYDSLSLCFGNVPDTMSQLIRTAFIAPKGKLLAVCDFSAIEARVLAWMAGEDWVLDVFREGGDIYCATASQMFHVPVEKHGQNAHLRQKGKVAVLALGYQGGVGALDKMGGSRMGMTYDEEKDTVLMWRNANPSIVTLWRRLETAARGAIIYGSERNVRTKYCCITFRMEGNGTMTIKIPSGRRICYPEATISGDKIRFKGMNQETKKWEWIDTYGGKLTENITQAIARDCLAYTMSEVFYPVVFHIHDELVMEIPDSNPERHLQDIEKTFTMKPAWADGLPLKGAGYYTPYYLKD